MTNLILKIACILLCFTSSKSLEVGDRLLINKKYLMNLVIRYYLKELCKYSKKVVELSENSKLRNLFTILLNDLSTNISINSALNFEFENNVNKLSKSFADTWQDSSLNKPDNSDQIKTPIVMISTFFKNKYDDLNLFCADSNNIDKMNQDLKLFDKFKYNGTDVAKNAIIETIKKSGTEHEKSLYPNNGSDQYINVIIGDSLTLENTSPYEIRYLISEIESLNKDIDNTSLISKIEDEIKMINISSSSFIRTEIEFYILNDKSISVRPNGLLKVNKNMMIPIDIEVTKPREFTVVKIEPKKYLLA